MKHLFFYPLFFFSITALPACTAGDSAQDSGEESWESASHDKGAPADYDRIFDESVVHRLDITIDADVYASMEAEMTEMFGEFDSGGPGSGGPGALGHPLSLRGTGPGRLVHLAHRSRTA